MSGDDVADKGFRMVRYYGVLGPAKRRLLEDVVYVITETVRKTVRQITLRGIYQQLLRVDPLKCILCGNRLRFQHTDWQPRGQQKRVVTLCQNEKYYLAGALHSGTGKVSYVDGNSKGSSLFISLLKHLKETYRRVSITTSSTKAVKRCAG